MKNLTFASIIALVGVAASSQAVTIATFDDPAANASTPLFTITDSSVTGSWTGTGLTLLVPYASASYSDVKMQLDTVSRSGFALGAGSVVFYTDDINDPIFTMSFSSGTIFEPFTAGSSTLTGDTVIFGGSALDGLDPLENQQFAFSFANAQGLGTDTRTYTAAMTSSADAVPEPATLTLLGAGLAAYAARRRKQSA